MREEADPPSFLEKFIQLPKFEGVIYESVTKYGPLTPRQMDDLLECNNHTGNLGDASSLHSRSGSALTNLSLNLHLLAYSTKTGLWYRTDDPQRGKPIHKKYIFPAGRSWDFPNMNPQEMTYETLGEGQNFVYVTYSCPSRLEAILNRRDSWPLKIGKTQDLDRRIRQLSETGPNSLVIGLAIKTNHESKLERALHIRLHQEGRNLAIPGRKEWFLSSVGQIRRIYQELDFYRGFNGSR